ncbi:trypsin-1-like [Zophobas morio]|uniref:trypsin-1-like n=1 Tax=Zophobas morio TaxID=2755281 RepID=UPI003083150E
MKAFLLLVVLVAVVSAKPAAQLRKPAFFRPSPRITNGDDAAPGQFPHQISYQWGILGFDQHVCGGTIISETWVLTAGHCVTEVPEIGDHKVIAGVTNLWEDTAEKQTINVVQKIVHSDFGGDVGPNDIALLKLASPLTFGDLVKPIALPEADSVPTGNAILSGWGSTSTSDIPVMPDQLQTTTIPLLSFEECSGAIESLLEQGEENPLSEESNICTGPLTGGISACSGDSGGPLIQDDNIIGIVSWGFTPCGSDGAPSVYTKVSNFIDFINQYVTDLPK